MELFPRLEFRLAFSLHKKKKNPRGACAQLYIQSRSEARGVIHI